MRYCLTGGIGAGKSYVCSLLREKGIEIYDTDNAAKRLIAQSPEIRRQLKELIGGLDKQTIAAFLLKSEENKLAINSIVHPAVIKDFLDSGYEWMECAIIYEAHLEQYVDKVIAVTAPREVRIERIMARDGITRKEAEQWIDAQYPQEKVAERADFVIINDGNKDLQKQIEEIWQRLF
jgi:dephospho-CoA kinase